MSFIARFLARLIWRGVLWLMRRKWMKTFQRNSVLNFPKSMRAKAWESLVRQNRFARRTGLPLITFMMSLVLGSIIITGTFLVAMHLYESGYLSIPWRMRRKLLDQE